MSNSQRPYVDRKESQNDNTDNSTPEKQSESEINQHIIKNEQSTVASSDDMYRRYNMYENMNNYSPDVELNKDLYPYLNSIGIDTREYIANNNDRRISEVNKYNWRESRRNSGVYYPDDKPVLQNIVSTCNLWWKLDLSMIAMKAKNTEFNPRRFAAAIMKIRNPKTTALIFSSGKMVWTGAKSEEASRLAAK